MKCSGNDYKNPPPPGTLIQVHHLGIYQKSQKLKYPSFMKIITDHGDESILAKKLLNKE